MIGNLSKSKGFKGDKGEQGIQGIQGVQGEKGDVPAIEFRYEHQCANARALSRTALRAGG